MTPLSKSRKATIYFKKWEYKLLLEFAESLLTKKNQQQQKGAYFKKSSLLPNSLIYFSSFLNARYLYDDHKQLIEKYKFLTGELEKISINHFYNLISFLLENGIFQVDSNTLYNHIEEAGKRSNNLTQKETVNNTTDFIQKLL